MNEALEEFAKEAERREQPRQEAIDDSDRARLSRSTTR